MSERIFRLRGDRNEILEKLKKNGARIVHRFGDAVVVEGDPLSGLSPVERSRLQEEPELPMIRIPESVSDDELQLYAYKLRKTAAFRKRKVNRPDEDEDWKDILGPCE